MDREERRRRRSRENGHSGLVERGSKGKRGVSDGGGLFGGSGSRIRRRNNDNDTVYARVAVVKTSPFSVLEEMTTIPSMRM
jgi:hypothetical protein